MEAGAQERRWNIRAGTQDNVRSNASFPFQPTSIYDHNPMEAALAPGNGAFASAPEGLVWRNE
jgi:hypothetical protein